LRRLIGPVAADLCVVGLGGSGLAAVGEALRRGLSVVGVDAGPVAAGAAGRNGGFLLAGPANPVHQAAAGWGLEAALMLYRQTLAEIDELGRLLGPEIVRRDGSIRLAGLPGPPRTEHETADQVAELADCERQFAFLRSHGVAVERYDGELGRGLFLPEDAAMNPLSRARGLARLYSARADLYVDSPMVGLSAAGVQTPSGLVSAAATVIAVDGRLERLVPELAGRVRTARLQMLATEPLAAKPDGTARLPCPVYGRWGYDYAQQLPGGQMFVGGGRDRFADVEWTLDTSPTKPVQDWIDAVAHRFAGGPVRVTHRWAASVGFTPDARPLVAEIRPGVVACGGYNGTGNLVGPIAARAAVALAVDGTPAPSYFAS
jgi:gamma-glutamylputrescine oxidase